MLPRRVPLTPTGVRGTIVCSSTSRLFRIARRCSSATMPGACSSALAKPMISRISICSSSAPGMPHLTLHKHSNTPVLLAVVIEQLSQPGHRAMTIRLKISPPAPHIDLVRHIPGRIGNVVERHHSTRAHHRPVFLVIVLHCLVVMPSIHEDEIKGAMPGCLLHCS